MEIALKDASGAEAGSYEVRFEAVEGRRGGQAVHEAVVAYLAARRSGTASTRTVAEVAGSGRKPWRQKGTGRARAGQARSPIWRGGGVAFGPRPRSFRKKVGRKTRRLAMRKALGERIRDGEVTVVESFGIERPRTRDFLGFCRAHGLEGTVLAVLDSVDESLILSLRNVPWAEAVQAGTLNVYEVLRPDRLVFTRKAFEMVDERLAGERD